MSIEAPVIYSDGRVRYDAGGVGYTGDTYPDNGASGTSVSAGSVIGSPSMAAGGVQPDDGFGKTDLDSAISNSSNSFAVIVAQPNLSGSTVSVSFSTTGNVSGTLGHDGSASGTSAVDEVSVTGSIIDVTGSGAFTVTVAGSAVGIGDFRSAVTAVSLSSGTVSVPVPELRGSLFGVVTVSAIAEGDKGTTGGTDSVNVSSSEVSGVPNVVSGASGTSVNAGDVSGVMDVSGSVSGTSGSSGVVSPLVRGTPQRKPPGYVWSFSGDATPIRNPTGMISALSGAIGSVGGSQGFAGSIKGGNVVAGSFIGRRRIREEDDMEILQLLELV